MINNLNLLQVANLLRSMYHSNKKPHQLSYLILLHYKKDLSVDEFTYFMDGMRTPKGEPITRRNVYGHLYGMEKSNLIYKEKMVSDEGHVCNVYYLTSTGREIIQPILDIVGNWDNFSKASTLAGFFSTTGSKPVADKTH